MSDPPQAPWSPGAVDLLVRVAGGLVAFVGGLLGGVLALVLVPLRIDTPAGLVRVPVAVLVAVLANLVLLWFARRATGVRWGVLLPALGWFVIVVAALGSTREGNRLLVGDDWVGALTIFLGTAVLAVGVVLAISRPRTQ